MYYRESLTILLFTVGEFNMKLTGEYELWRIRLHLNKNEKWVWRKGLDISIEEKSVGFRMFKYVGVTYI